MKKISGYCQEIDIESGGGAGSILTVIIYNHLHLAMKAQRKFQDLRLFFVACYHELFCINFKCASYVLYIRKEEVSASGLPSWLLELVPAVKYDINNVSYWFPV